MPHILIVDDDLTHTKLLQGLLQNAGYAVSALGTSGVALAALRGGGS